MNGRLNEKRMDQMGDLIGRNYARSQNVLSTAAILAGNIKDKSYLPALERLLEHPHPPIRGHSAWAIGQIGSSSGAVYYKGVLERALKDEDDTRVIEEIHRAMNSSNNFMADCLVF